jgi:hypothetical protein
MVALALATCAGVVVVDAGCAAELELSGRGRDLSMKKVQPSSMAADKTKAISNRFCSIQFKSKRKHHRQKASATFKLT